MTKANQLVQRNFYEYESNRRHVDDMTPQGAESNPDLKEENEEEAAQTPAGNVEFFSGLETYKRRHPGQWPEGTFEKIGPMVVWDEVAQQLERLVERLEHH